MHRSLFIPTIGLLCLLIVATFSYIVYIGSPRSKSKISDHFNGYRFSNTKENLENTQSQKSVLDFLRWQLTSHKPVWVNKNIIQQKPQKNINLGELVATYVNHATVLIQTRNYSFIIDPVFSERMGPLNFLSAKRFHQPGIAFESLPNIDYVLVSHDHYDHLDIPTLERFTDSASQPIFLTGLGNGYWMNYSGAKFYQELDWWSSVSLPKGGEIYFVPSRHWSGRSIGDRRKTLWGGFVIKTQDFNIYYSGDTAYTNTFKEINRKFGDFDLCILPIGAYEPRRIMESSHMNPSESVQAHIDLGCKKTMAVHFGTFQLADEPQSEPENLLNKSLREKNISEYTFQALEPGKNLRIFKR